MRYIIVFLILFTATSSMAASGSTIYVLNKADASTLYSVFQYALENTPNQQAADWQNPSTGLSGSTLPIKTYQTSYGQYCREYLATLQIDGAMQQAFGTACRQGNGSWKIAGEKLVKRPGPQLKFVIVNRSHEHGSQHVFRHPPSTLLKIKCSPHGDVSPNQGRQNFHTDQFHQQLRQLKRGGQPQTVPRQIEKQQPSKLLKLVSY